MLLLKFMLQCGKKDMLNIIFFSPVVKLVQKLLYVGPGYCLSSPVVMSFKRIVINI